MIHTRARQCFQQIEQYRPPLLLHAVTRLHPHHEGCVRVVDHLEEHAETGGAEGAVAGVVVGARGEGAHPRGTVVVGGGLGGVVQLGGEGVGVGVWG